MRQSAASLLLLAACAQGLAFAPQAAVRPNALLVGKPNAPSLQQRRGASSTLFSAAAISADGAYNGDAGVSSDSLNVKYGPGE